MTLMPPRSWLFVPADSEKKIAKALDSEADAIIFDLEDSVAADRKAAARALIKALPPREGGPRWWVRINPLDGPHAAEPRRGGPQSVAVVVQQGMLRRQPPLRVVELRHIATRRQVRLEQRHLVVLVEVGPRVVDGLRQILAKA